MVYLHSSDHCNMLNVRECLDRWSHNEDHSEILAALSSWPGLHNHAVYRLNVNRGPFLDHWMALPDSIYVKVYDVHHLTSWHQPLFQPGEWLSLNYPANKLCAKVCPPLCLTGLDQCQNWVETELFFHDNTRLHNAMLRNHLHLKPVITQVQQF